jgi:quinol monooxygenase YgiN
MSLNIDTRSMRRRLLRYAILLVALLAIVGGARAQEPGMHDKIYVVAHVDVLPTEAATGTKLLKQYAEESRKDKGAVRIEVYVQVSRVNHFSVVEVWENRQAFDAHEAAPHTKKFREQIDPLLGSPYDERLHTMSN